jgi:aspartyl-tRNA(Asn)/glutamyl-tRNA(Gln) amidotransferase subunit A
VPSTRGLLWRHWIQGTYGLLSTNGILEGEKAEESILWYSHPGVTTRSVQDTFIVVRALAEPQRRDDLDRSEPHAREKNVLRLGVADNAKPEAQVAPVFAAAVESLLTLGHHVVKTTAPFDLPGFDDLRTIEVDRQNVSDRAFRDVDVFVLPTLTGAVLSVDQARGNPRALSPAFTVFANYFGLPAVSVPCGFDDNGLPVGLQFVGKPWDDAVVLDLADQFAAANQSVQRHPIP